jgi:hypothetical protein
VRALNEDVYVDTILERLEAVDEEAAVEIGRAISQ